MPSRYFGGTGYVNGPSGVWVPDAPVTFAGWFKIPNNTTSYALMGCMRTGAIEYSVMITDTGGKIQSSCRRSSSSIGTATTPNAFDKNDWFFAAATVHSSTDRRAYLYSKGMWGIGTDTTSITSANGTDPDTRIGSSLNSPGSALVGLIAAPHVFSRALSFDEIRNLAFNTLSTRRSSMNVFAFDGQSPETQLSEANSPGTVTGLTYPVFNDEPPITIHNARPRVLPYRPASFGIRGRWAADAFILGKAPAAGGGGFKSGWAMGSNAVIGAGVAA